ncbi:MAG: hypothetical protein ABS75_32990 [Pelagibacterium sp. SCN 63-23]|nr:MAG: hypothetical protein ABS75_32990 [Pelagibacterium sp. SCN 63-23]
MMKTILRATFLTLALAAPALAAGDGTAIGVNPDALQLSGAAERTLVVGADVSVGDRITTGPSGRVQLLFADDTRIVVGPGSALEIEAYLLNGNRADKFAVNALAGTFRFISGSSPKSAYSIDTPTASIAVRGTRFDVTVGRGWTHALLYEGALEMCHGNTCITLAKRCDVGALGGIREGLFVWGHPERGELVGNFPLPNIQSAFRSDFRINGSQACLAPPQGQSAISIESPPDGGGSVDESSGGGRICPPQSTAC